jgi:hypothetical protein
VKLAAWTASRDSHAVTVPALTDRFDVVSHLGQPLPPVTPDGTGLPIVLGPAVQYLRPQKPSDELRRAAKADRMPLEVVVKAPAEKMGRTVSRGDHSVPVDVPIGYIPPTLSQRTWLVVSNPLHATVLAPEPGALPVRVSSPSGDGFFGTLRLHNAPGFKTIVNLPAGKTETTVSLPLAPARGGINDDAVAAELVDDAGRVVLITPATRFTPIDLSSPAKFDVRGEGDPNVKSTQTLSAGGDGPHGRASATLKVSYSFDAGWKYLNVTPKDTDFAAVNGKPKSLALWIRSSDATGDTVRFRFTDSTGQTFQPDGPKLDTRDWRQVTFRISPAAHHWGGAADGVIHWPIKIESLVLIDSTKAAHAGEISIAEPTLVYEDSPAPATTKP